MRKVVHSKEYDVRLIESFYDYMYRVPTLQELVSMGGHRYESTVEYKVFLYYHNFLDLVRFDNNLRASTSYCIEHDGIIFTGSFKEISDELNVKFKDEFGLMKYAKRNNIKIEKRTMFDFINKFMS